MNLGQAKNVLIIAFLGLNLFLGYQLFWPNFGRLTNVAVTAEELSAVEDTLNDNNYYLETSVDRGVKKSKFLKVSPHWGFQESVVEKFIDQGAEIVSAQDPVYYRLDDVVVLEHQSGLLQMIYNPGVPLDDDLDDPKDLDDDDLHGLVEEFLIENELMPEGIRFDYVEKIDENAEKKEVIFNQEFDDRPIFAGHFRVVVEKGTIKTVDMFWLKPIERIPEREMEVIPASDALHNLLNKLGPSTKEHKIKDIELGFYSGEYEAEKWEIPPVWRVSIDENEHYYINAFTGNPEQDLLIPEKLPGDDNK
ncbi:MAG: two-component system regulatory protein YycI [Bacillota bacterium]